jgi:peptidoglycan/xylan/chitin deacetylase (PgdA/CDA1 family)
MSRFSALIYHNILATPGNRYDLTPGAFRDQLRWMRDAGYTIDSMAGLRSRLAQGTVPERYVVVTFDDGHGSNLVAAEILAGEDAQATFLISVSFCREDPGFLNPTGMVELAGHMDIGSHGISHDLLNKMDLPQLREELRGSKAWIEDIIGRRVDDLALPGGGISRLVLREAASAGYDLVATSIDWWNRERHIARTRRLNRSIIYPSYSMDRFQQIVGGDLRYFAPHRLRYTTFRAARRVLPEDFVLAQSRRRDRSTETKADE